MWYVNRMKHYSALKNGATLPFVTTGMNLKDIMLSEISQSEGQWGISPSYVVSKIIKVIAAENVLVVCSQELPGEGQIGDHCSIGIKFHLCKMNKF